MKMLMIFCLMITLTSQHVHSKVITINTTGGSDNTTCCVDGVCVCTSLSTALLSMTNNTIINITSESVTLEGNIKMGSLNNITVTGNGVTVTCINIGSVYCEDCNNVIIHGITWDKCGDGNPNRTNVAGVTFNITSNISLCNCTFQHSPIQAVSLLETFETVVVNHCKFTLNGMEQSKILSAPLVIKRSRGCDDLNITISDCNIFHNGYETCKTLRHGLTYLPLSLFIGLTDNNSSAKYFIFISNTNISSSKGAALIKTEAISWITVQFTSVKVFDQGTAIPGCHHHTYIRGIAIIMNYYKNDCNNNHSYYRLIHIIILSSTFSSNDDNNMYCHVWGTYIDILVADSNFTNSVSQRILPLVDIKTFSRLTQIEFSNIFIINNTNLYTDDSFGERKRIISINHYEGDINVSMVLMRLKSNIISSGNSTNMYNFNKVENNEGILYIISHASSSTFNLHIEDCECIYNKYSGQGAILYAEVALTDITLRAQVNIINTQFFQNIADNGIINIVASTMANLKLSNSNFANNFGSTIFLSNLQMDLHGTVMFVNNTADIGVVIHQVQLSFTAFINATVHFINNSASLYGGAIYVNYVPVCKSMCIFDVTNSSVYFINNTAGIAGNSLYFNIPKYCEVDADSHNKWSIMYFPCQWSYHQLVNGKLINITCDYDYTLLKGTPFPVVTSPHELKLYFVNDDGVNISSNSLYNTYLIKNSILGHTVIFNGAVFDYFGKPAESTLFSLHCIDCSNFKLDTDHLFVDNVKSLSIIFTGSDIVKNVNLSLDIISLPNSLLNIKTTLIVELQPCTSNPGFVYNNIKQHCICYDHKAINCYDTYNEVKRGYWFGSVAGTPTTSLCPNHYCNFVDRKETRQGYFELPKKINDQCEHHRTGIACGECSPGYTLAYDSTDCISVDHCSAGMTLLVVVLTCLYWIAVVVGVFSLMYFNIRLLSGYLNGVIYYYSMVGILLDNNPYISGGGLLFVSVLSSFAQLNIQFLRKVCFIKELSGIDQLFIRYVHAVSVALLTVVIVITARCSARIALFIRKCIIQVMCLLILLSYTSLASTSLQLLRPIRFTGINKVYTYASPNIRYFHGRHTIYGIIAAICEIVVVVGLPLFLLLERFITRKIVVKVMPLLDQFQSCFKNKYRWFAAYYLICRQVIMLIVFVGNNNYYNMLFYLQTACVVIAMVHIWVLPYKDDTLNALDGLILLIMVLVVNINTFPFLEKFTTEISIVLVLLPLLLICFMIIKKKVLACAKKCNLHQDEYNYDFEDDEQFINKNNAVIHNVLLLNGHDSDSEQLDDEN